MLSSIIRRVISRHRQRAQQRLEIIDQANNPLLAVDPSLQLPEDLETIFVNDVVMSAEVQCLLIASGPVEIDYNGALGGYRLTGPNINSRLHHAIACAGERPLIEDEIVEGPQMTATEVIERRRAFYAEIRYAQERAANPPLLICPGAINYGTTSLIPPSPNDTEKVERKAKAALWRYLNEQQQQDLFCLGRFIVNGGESKMAYNILKGRQGNVWRDDDAHFCLTHGDLPVWDLMLAQKLMIEDSEPQFLELANRLDVQQYY